MSDISGKLEEIIMKLDERTDPQVLPHDYDSTIADRLRHISNQIELLPNVTSDDITNSIKSSYKINAFKGNVTSSGDFTASNIPFIYSKHIILFARIRDESVLVIPYMPSSGNNYAFKVIDPSTFKPVTTGMSQVYLEVIFLLR